MTNPADSGGIKFPIKLEYAEYFLRPFFAQNLELKPGKAPSCGP